MFKSLTTILLYILLFNPSLSFAQCTWNHDSTFHASDSLDHFGKSVVLSKNGNIMAVGLPFNDDNGLDAGRVTIYEKDTNGWSQLGNHILGDSAGDYFGWSVDFSSSGDTIIVGAIGSDVNGDSSGMVKILHFKDTSWVQVGKSLYGTNRADLFGFSVSMNGAGNAVAIGAPWNGYSTVNKVGVVYIYYLTKNNWSVYETFRNNNRDSWFGFDLALSKNMNPNIFSSLRLIVGAPHDKRYSNTESGSVTIIYVEMSKYIEQLMFPNPKAYAHAGTSVDISDDGLTVIVSTPDNDVGYVDAFYSPIGHGYTYRGKKISGTNSASPIGNEIALSGDGNTIAISSPKQLSDSGVTKQYRFDERNGWILVMDSIKGKTKGSNFGAALDLSFRGKRIAIGAPLGNQFANKSGNVQVHDFNGLLNNITSADTVSFKSYCFPYKTSGGKTLDSSGWYLDTLVTSGGCDRVTWIDFVRYRDTILPTINTKFYGISMYDSVNEVTLDVNRINNVSRDDCGIDTMYFSQETVTCDDVDSNNIFFYVKDISGNVDSVKANILVGDYQPPIVKSRDITIYLDTSGNAVANPDSVDIGTYDNCTLTSVELEKSIYGCKDLGDNYTYLYGIDRFGNKGISTVKITVADTFMSVDTVKVLECDHFISPSGKYFEDPTTFNDTIIGSTGCDSVVYFDLSLINKIVYDSTTIFAPKPHGNFGEALSINHDGSIIAIGSPREPFNTYKAGVVRIYQKTKGYWHQLGNEIEGEHRFDESGKHLDLSNDGKTIAIGSEKNDDGGTDAGHVRTYTFTKGNWVQHGSDLDGNPGEYSGFSVALSGNGRRMIVGAPRATVGGAASAGIARVYEYIGSDWKQIGSDIKGVNSDDNLGYSVAMSSNGTIISVVAPGYKSTKTQVYKFSSGDWVQVGKDIPFTGYSSDMSSDGSNIVIATRHTTKAFNYNGTTWEQLGQELKIKSTDHQIGLSVACSGKGDRLIIGAGKESIDTPADGQVLTYQLIAKKWIPITRPSTGDSIGHHFGTTVTMSADGKTFAGSSPIARRSDGQPSGKVKIFTKAAKVIHDPDTVNVSLCNGLFVSPWGKKYRSMGYFQEKYRTSDQCDSIITFGIIDSIDYRFTIDTIVCDRFTTLKGKSIDSSGIYTEVFPDTTFGGCDTIYTYRVNVGRTLYDTTSEIVCNQYVTKSGKQWNKTGIYYDTLVNRFACDSFLTIDLTVNHNSFDTIWPSACERYVSQAGKSYLEDGIYHEFFKNQYGCDSTLTINLNIRSRTSDTLVITSCDTFVSASGTSYFKTGVYKDIVTNAAGCDSSIYYFLTILNSTHFTMDTQSCKPFISSTGKVWSTSGSYKDTLFNSKGCDSIITYQYKNLGTAIQRHPLDTIVKKGNDGYFSISVKSPLSFQWQKSEGLEFSNLQTQSNYDGINSDTLWVRQVSTSDHLDIFRCIVSNNTCSDTSNSGQLLINLNITSLPIEINIYPNPVRDKLFIEVTPNWFGRAVVILDSKGKKVHDLVIRGSLETIDISNLSKGVYYLNIDQSSMTKLIKY